MKRFAPLLLLVAASCGADQPPPRPEVGVPLVDSVAFTAPPDSLRVLSAEDSARVRAVAAHTDSVNERLRAGIDPRVRGPAPAQSPAPPPAPPADCAARARAATTDEERALILRGCERLPDGP